MSARNETRVEIENFSQLVHQGYFIAQLGCQLRMPNVARRSRRSFGRDHGRGSLNALGDRFAIWPQPTPESVVMCHVTEYHSMGDQDICRSSHSDVIHNGNLSPISTGCLQTGGKKAGTSGPGQYVGGFESAAGQSPARIDGRTEGSILHFDQCPVAYLLSIRGWRCL